MKLGNRMLACGLAGCAVVAVSACGSSGPTEPSASDLQSSARSAVASAKSVHYDGQSSNHGIAVAVNMGVTRAGGLSGTITQNGTKLQLLGAGGKVYVKATSDFLRELRAPASACSIVCGKWIQLPAQAASQITSQLTLRSLTGEVNASTASKLTEAGSSSVNGQPTWVMKAPGGGTMDVTQTSPHYPLRVRAGSGKTGLVKFSHWNAVPTPAAPPPSQVVNLNGLHP